MKKHWRFFVHMWSLWALESFGKKNSKQNKKWSGDGAHGGCFQGFGILSFFFFSGHMTWTGWDFLTVFHNKFRASCGEPQCLLPLFAETCSSSSSIHITQSPPSPLSMPLPSSRLRVLFFVSCVMSIYLSIDLSVHFTRGLLVAAAAAGSVCYNAAIRLAATS